jgi:hypothetical protein
MKTEITLGATVDLDLLKFDQALLIAELEKAGTSIHDPAKAFSCPWHGEDRHPSANLYRTPDGHWRFKCHSCALNRDVIDVLAFNVQMPVADWMRAQRQGERPAATAKSERPAVARSEMVAVYYYNSSAGDPLYRKTRIEEFAADGSRIRKLTPFEKFDNGKWVGGAGCMAGLSRVLYRNEQLSFRQQIFIVEGEKAADLLWDFGILATCSDGGAGSWRPEYSRALAGKQIVILPDADEPGRRHAETVAESLIGLARSIKILELPNLTAKQDAYDWIGANV